MSTAHQSSGNNGNTAQMLTRYKAWANDIMFSSLAELPPEELVKERKTHFKTILSTMNHTYVVDDMFRAHLEGRKHGYLSRNTEEIPSLEDLAHAVRQMDQWYVDLANDLTDDELSEIIQFEFVGGGKGAMTHMEIILHVVNHGTYHNGFVTDMIYQIPGKTGTNDLPVFLRDVWHKGK